MEAADALSAPAVSRQRLSSAGVLFVALTLANLSNYLFQVVASRLLGPADYSLLGGVFAFVTVVTVSTGSFQAAAAKAVAARLASGAPLRLDPPPARDPFTVLTLKWAVVAAGLVALASPLLQRFLHSGLAPTAALPLYVIAAPVVAVGFGRLQGMEAFNAFAWIALGLAVARLVMAPVVIAAGGGVTGLVVVGGLLIGAAAVACFWASRGAGAIPFDAVRGDVVRASIALTLFWLIVSLDVPVARHWLPAKDAGQYAAAAVIGKAVLWLPGAISLVMFPRVTLLREKGKATHPVLMWSLGLTAGLCVAGVAGLWLLGPSVLPLFFGRSYVVASHLAWKVGAVSALLAISNLLIFYHLTRQTGRFVGALTIAIVAEIGLYSVLHHTYDQVVLASGLSALVLVLGLLLPGTLRRLHDLSKRPGVPARRAWAKAGSA